MSQSTFNLLDGLRPLTRYLSISQPEEPSTKNLDKSIKSRSDEMISDWGIDMDSTNSPTLVGIDGNRSSLGNLQVGGHGLYGTSDDDLTIASPIIPRIYEGFNLLPNPSNISIESLLEKSLKKFDEVDGKFQKFQDEFKYILITSQLLDETILISKHKKKISTLQLNHTSTLLMTKFGNVFMNSGSHYSMSGNIDSLTYLHLISFIRHLISHHQNFTKTQLKSMLIIITINLYILSNYKAICYKVIEITILNNLRKFIKNYQKFDISIVKLLNKYKELTIFPNMLPNNIPSRSSDILKSDKIYHLSNSSVSLLTTHILNNIHDLFESMNGSGLENYCGIYNIQLNELNYYLSNESISNNLSNYERLLQNLKKFQYLRRFLICCLLSNNEIHQDTTFLNKIAKIFQIDEKSYNNNHINIFNKLNLISTTLENIQKLSNLLNSNIIEFIKIEKISTSSTSNEDANQLITKAKLPNTSTKLFAKLKELQLNLTTLDKNESIDNQIEEFSKIGELLTSVNQIYHQDLSNLQKSSQTNKPFNLVSTTKSSPSNSTNSHISLSKRKRFSLPPQQHLTPQTRGSPRTTSLNSMSPATPNSNSSTPKNYKRLSTGLSISLLTVMENENDIFDVTNHKKVSYDDNYINITPNLQSPAYLATESKGRDYITENQLLSNDDSVIITNSNSDENDNELETNVLDNDEFKRRLENNFNRVLSSSTVIGNSTMNNEIIEHNGDTFVDEINYNDAKIDNIQGGLLMDELKNKMSGTLNL